ncbi:MAG: DNA alkylation repair protein [Saprospiraceae bacterium]|nr:DNA alkylation repair protein [Saprospiraceae bacterium]
MAENFELRDFYNPGTITILADSLKEVYPDFPHESFLKRVIPALPPLGLLERSNVICDAFEALLPDDFKNTSDILVKNVQQSLPLEGEGAVNGFMVLPHTQYIARNGLDYFDISMRALYELTKKFTSEFAIRPFLIHRTEETLAVLKKWATDENEHVRRLVSEGTRPLLPWGMKLKNFEQDPSHCFNLLEHLKDDPSLYVRKSVANHLNDHSKKHPDKVVALLTSWNKGNPSKGTQWITRHALRSLIKQGHTGAMVLQGFGSPEKVLMDDFEITTPEVNFGETLNFGFSIFSKEKKPIKLVVDYILYFKKANGALAPKVFKLKEMMLEPSTKNTIRKNHPIRPITTRKYYPGMQEIGIQINGREFARKSFLLKME